MGRKSASQSRKESASLEARVATIAARQHGVVTSRQLEKVGLSRRAAAKRAESGQLHRIHHGVYAVGHPPVNFHGWWMAAVLACGEGAVLSHGSAAALWGLLRPIGGLIDVSVPTGAFVSPRDPKAPCRSRHRPPPHSRDDCAADGRRLAGGGGAVVGAAGSAEAELMGVQLEGAEGRKTRSELEDEFLRLCALMSSPDRGCAS